MTKDTTMAYALRFKGIGTFLAVATTAVFVMGADGGGCGAATPTPSSPPVTDAGPGITDVGGASASTSGATEQGKSSTGSLPIEESSARESSVGAASDVSGVPDGGTDDAAGTVNTGGDSCIEADNACADGGLPCCPGKVCLNGICGICLQEGDDGCSNDKPCCDGLACNQGTCGTDLCLPDGKSCTASGSVCCNDDCLNGKCGG
jgi:hypothetical protein